MRTHFVATQVLHIVYVLQRDEGNKQGKGDSLASLSDDAKEEKEEKEVDERTDEGEDKNRSIEINPLLPKAAVTSVAQKRREKLNNAE